MHVIRQVRMAPFGRHPYPSNTVINAGQERPELRIEARIVTQLPGFPTGMVGRVGISEMG